MAQPSKNFTITTAAQDDIPALAEIHVRACKPDLAISLYFTSEADFLSRVTSMLESQLGLPEWTHIKCIDSESGSIAGWSSWTQMQYSAEDVSQYSADSSGSSSDFVKAKDGFNFPPGLGQHLKRDTERVFRARAQQRPHFQLKGLFVDPAFQRRGMGAAMVRAAMEHAARNDLLMLVQASPFGYPVYRAQGFEVFGDLAVDLKDWAPGAAGGDRGWGMYRLRYMVHGA